MATHTERGTESSTKSIDQMLDRPGFAEFLANLKTQRGVEGEANERFMSEGIEVFERFEKVKDGVAKLYSEELKQELGVALDTAGTEALESYLRKEILENPNGLKTMERLLEKHKEHASHIHELEGHFDVRIKGAKDKEAFHADLGNIVTMRKRLWGGLGHFASSDFATSREQLRERYGFQGKGDKETREGIQLVAQARLQMLETRQQLLGRMLQDEAMAKAVHQSAITELRRLASGSFSDMGKAGGVLESLKGLVGRAGVSEELLPDVEDVEADLDTTIETRAKALLDEALTSAETGERARFTNLEKSLKEFLNGSALSTKDQEDAGEFVGKVILEKLATTDLSPVQRIFLERVKHKLIKGLYTA